MGEIELAPRQVPAYGEMSGYHTTQRVLCELIEGMKKVRCLVVQLVDEQGENAARATTASEKAHESDFDGIPVALAKAVATGIGGVEKDGQVILAAVDRMISKAYDALVEHEKRYGHLHRVRVGRKYKTPKPGAFRRPV